MRSLVVIPARGGSKGIPRKNIKFLNGKPLIHYAIEEARILFDDCDICVSTDDDEIKEVVESIGLDVPFLRPAYLAEDNSGSYEVLIHALEHFEGEGNIYDVLVLLQPTSPFRKFSHIKGAIEQYTSDLDMVVSVKESGVNPYYSLFEENSQGYLEKSKEGGFIRRQDCPKVYEYNGAVYVINVNSLKEKPLHEFEKINKYLMDNVSSLDLDTPLDWAYCEFLIDQNIINV